MNIGIIGASGYWGRKIVQVAVEIDGVNIYSCLVHSKSGKTSQLLKNIFPVDKMPILLSSRIQFMEDSKVDSIIIATPSETHYLLAKEALLNGKNVFIEKPMCLSIHEAQDLVSIARETKKLIFIDHTYLHSKCLKYMQRLINENFIGQPLFLHSNRNQIGIFRESGVLWDLCPHDLSIIYFLFPNEIIKNINMNPWSHVKSMNSHGQLIIDTAHYSITFKSGLNTSNFVTWCHPKWARDFSIIGTEGMILFENNSIVKPFKLKSPSTCPDTHRVFEKDQWILRKEYSPKDNPLKNAILEFCEFSKKPPDMLPSYLQHEFYLRIVETIDKIDSMSIQ